MFRAVAAPLLLLQANPPTYTVLDANDAVGTLLGVGRAGLVGRGYFDLFYPDSAALDNAPGDARDAMRASFARVLADGESDAMPAYRQSLAGPDGAAEERFWRATNAPIRDAVGVASCRCWAMPTTTPTASRMGALVARQKRSSAAPSGPARLWR